MNVTSLDLGGFPTVARGVAQAGRAVARLLAGMPARWDVDVPPFGGASVEVVGIGSVPEDTVAVALRRDEAAGRLSMPVALASRWVDRAIGAGETFAPVRALGPAERGVLIALLGPVLDSLGWSVTLGPAPDLSGPAVVLRVVSTAGAGPVWLQADAVGRGRLSAARSALVPIQAALWLASTTLAAGPLAELSVGDLLVFDAVPALPVADEQSWPLDIVVGGFRAAGRVDCEGRVSVAEGWRAKDDPARDQTRKPRKDVTMDPDKTDPAAAALAAAPLEVIAELGRLTLRGEEVLALAPGVVLGLRVERTSAVSLRVGGELWAEGELVNVEGELGVRVTRLVPR